MSYYFNLYFLLMRYATTRIAENTITDIAILPVGCSHHAGVGSGVEVSSGVGVVSGVSTGVSSGVGVVFGIEIGIDGKLIVLFGVGVGVFVGIGKGNPPPASSTPSTTAWWLGFSR